MTVKGAAYFYFVHVHSQVVEILRKSGFAAGAHVSKNCTVADDSKWGGAEGCMVDTEWSANFVAILFAPGLQQRKWHFSSCLSHCAPVKRVFSRYASTIQNCLGAFVKGPLMFCNILEISSFAVFYSNQTSMHKIYSYLKQKSMLASVAFPRLCLVLLFLPPISWVRILK